VVEVGKEPDNIWLLLVDMDVWIKASPSTFIARVDRRSRARRPDARRDEAAGRRGGDDCCRAGFLLPGLVREGINGL
jgi:hypothetical protein